MRHPDVLLRMGSHLIQSLPLFEPNFLQPLLDVEAEIDSWGEFKPPCGDLCSRLAISGDLSDSFEDFEG